MQNSQHSAAPVQRFVRSFFSNSLPFTQRRTIRLNRCVVVNNAQSSVTTRQLTAYRTEERGPFHILIEIVNTLIGKHVPERTYTDSLSLSFENLPLQPQTWRILNKVHELR